MFQYVQNVLCTILSNLGFPRFWPKIFKIPPNRKKVTSGYPNMCKLLCTTLSNLRFLRFWQGSTKNSLGSTRNLYQNLFQTILSNFGFEPRSKDVLFFGQILSNRKNSLGSKQNLYQNFLEKVLVKFWLPNYSVFTCTCFGSVCTDVYTYVHFCTLSYMCTLWHVYTLIPQCTDSLKIDNCEKSVPLHRQKLLENFPSFL